MKTSAIKVGLFFFAGIAIFTFLILKYKHIEFYKNYYEIHAFFDSVSGIEENSQVKLMGLKIGRVSKIIPQPDKNKMKVFMKIRNEISISNDASAKLQMENVMGGKFILISFGKSKSFLKDNDFIRSENEMDIEQLVQTVAQTADEAKILIKDFNANQNKLLEKAYHILNENQGKIKNFLANVEEITSTTKPHLKSIMQYIDSSMPELKLSISNIEQITASLKNGKGTAGKLITDSKLYEDLTATVNDIKFGVGKFNGILARNENNIDSIIVDIKHTIAPIKMSFQNLSEITGKIRNGEGTIGKLISDTEIYSSVKNSMDKFNENLETQREQSVMSSFTSTILGIFKF